MKIREELNAGEASPQVSSPGHTASMWPRSCTGCESARRAGIDHDDGQDASQHGAEVRFRQAPSPPPACAPGCPSRPRPPAPSWRSSTSPPSGTAGIRGRSSSPRSPPLARRRRPRLPAARQTEGDQQHLQTAVREISPTDRLMISNCPDSTEMSYTKTAATTIQAIRNHPNNHAIGHRARTITAGMRNTVTPLPAPPRNA